MPWRYCTYMDPASMPPRFIMQSQTKTYITFLLKHLCPLGYETLNCPFKKSFQTTFCQFLFRPRKYVLQEKYNSNFSKSLTHIKTPVSGTRFVLNQNFFFLILFNEANKNSKVDSFFLFFILHLYLLNFFTSFRRFWISLGQKGKTTHISLWPFSAPITSK